MRICIPTANESGLDSNVHEHFGSAPFFAFADTDTGAVEVIGNTGTHREYGQCRPADSVRAARTSAVVCHGMGQRAYATLRGEGVEVWITTARTVRGAIADARTGNVRRLSADTACGGHGEQCEHGSEHRGS